MVVFVVKRYAVREAKNGGTQYAMPKQSGTQYARGEGGVTLFYVAIEAYYFYNGRFGPKEQGQHAQSTLPSFIFVCVGILSKYNRKSLFIMTCIE